MAVRTPSSEPSELLTRLETENSTNCWVLLTQLQSCIGEVIQFFYNGETHLGTECCHAIHVVQHSCWPAMLGALGFTPEESDVLRGYCDAEQSAPSTPLISP
ncbi:hypothetical protein Nepgr_014253 [Nepenthes gracilis]|uniref:Prolamin-like domain-containing protein n=1 Tax=Nepenthes gracilis TaxID=150966 RepID=A0AAD3SJP3_NEPGR|nr:hypothetical protein Nepgr_014253 [Nepenthes gracilis]